MIEAAKSTSLPTGERYTDFRVVSRLSRNPEGIKIRIHILPLCVIYNFNYMVKRSNKMYTDGKIIIEKILTLQVVTASTEVIYTLKT